MYLDPDGEAVYPQQLRWQPFVGMAAHFAANVADAASGWWRAVAVEFFSAANQGNIGVVSILGSLSPLVTALLALVLLRERMARLETIALAIVVAGTCLVAV